MNNVEKLDIINFEDAKWLILEILNVEDKKYLYLVKMEDEEVTDQILIVSFYEKNDEIYIDEITEESELKMIGDLFLPIIDNNY